jgi:hypothetical protein
VQTFYKIQNLNQNSRRQKRNKKFHTAGIPTLTPPTIWSPGRHPARDLCTPPTRFNIIWTMEVTKFLVA